MLRNELIPVANYVISQSCLHTKHPQKFKRTLIGECSEIGPNGRYLEGSEPVDIVEFGALYHISSFVFL